MRKRLVQNRADERWKLISSGAEHPNKRLAIFVHGFGGGYLDTWGNLGELLVKHADDAAPFADWDYLFLGYSTWNIQTYLDISELLSTQLNAAAGCQVPYGSKYDRFALIGHSLGTLGYDSFYAIGSRTDRIH